MTTAYLSLPERPGILEYLFYEIPGIIYWTLTCVYKQLNYFGLYIYMGSGDMIDIIEYIGYLSTILF